MAPFVSVCEEEEEDDDDDDVEAAAAASAALCSASLVGKGICGRFPVAGLSDFMRSEISIVPPGAALPPPPLLLASDTITEEGAVIPKDL